MNQGIVSPNVVLIIMFILVIIITMNNFRMMKRAGQNKDYINCYKAMMNKDENAYEMIRDYIANAKSEEFRNKARIFKLFYDLEGDDYMDEIELLDLHDFYHTNGKLDPRKIDYNSESALWLTTLMAKANKLGRKDAVNALYKKIDEQDRILDNYVEYNVLRSAKDIFNGNKQGNDFLRDLLAGEYRGYKYDKTTIGVTKKIAGCLLDYNHSPYADFDGEIREFAKTKFGAMFMESLGIENKYKEEINELENTIAEEKEEKTEE